uniref:Wsv285-like protein n=1 Tax=Metapenaeus ensis majanivirus TaxID=2984279 RepID=A0A9C7F0I5_9VIRU|nr:MAG: wsv285-like protein [Metapenaeus ensis majanivirus]
METKSEKIIQLLYSITNNRKSINTRNAHIDKNTIANAIGSGPSPSDEQGWTNIMTRLQDEQRYLENVRQSIVELSKCKGDKKFNYNGEDSPNLQNEHLESLYKEGVYWEGIITSKNILVVTINIFLDIIQHMGGNELWLFNRLYKDICKTKMTVSAFSDNIPVDNNYSMSNGIWICSKFNYETSGTDDIKLALNHLSEMGCFIKHRMNNTSISNIYYNFRFTDTALGCPIELSTGSGCFNKMGQNVSLEKKENLMMTTTTIIGKENNNSMDNSSFINRLMGKNTNTDNNNNVGIDTKKKKKKKKKKKTRFDQKQQLHFLNDDVDDDDDDNNNNDDDDDDDDDKETAALETSYILRGKFPTLGPRGNFDEHKHIAKKYINFLENVLTSLDTPLHKLYEKDIFDITNHIYDTNLAVFLAIIHPKVKYRFLLSLFLTIVLIRTRGYRSDTYFDKKKINHGRDTKVSTMDNTGPRYRFVNETCACRDTCPNANRYYSHPIHNHHPLEFQGELSHIKDPLLGHSDYKNTRDKCYPNRVVHQHYCGVIFSCKRSDNSILGIKNGTLSLRCKDPQSNTQNYSVDMIESLPEYHRQTCHVSCVKEFLNNMVLKSWDSICEIAKKRGMSYRDLLLKFLKVPLLLGNLEKELNAKFLESKSNCNYQSPKDLRVINVKILYDIFPIMSEVFDVLSLFFDYNTEKIFSNLDENNQVMDATTIASTTNDKIFQKKISEAYKGVKFLINKKAATFITTINNHFYIMSQTALIGFRHKCELNSQYKVTSEGLKFHQISLQNYSLICSPDYIYKNNCQQLHIDNAAVEAAKENYHDDDDGDDNDKNESILNLMNKEKINNIIQNTFKNFDHIFGNDEATSGKNTSTTNNTTFTTTTAAAAAAAAAAATTTIDDDNKTNDNDSDSSSSSSSSITDDDDDDDNDDELSTSPSLLANITNTNVNTALFPSTTATITTTTDTTITPNTNNNFNINTNIDTTTTTTTNNNNNLSPPFSPSSSFSRSLKKRELNDACNGESKKIKMNNDAQKASSLSFFTMVEEENEIKEEEEEEEEEEKEKKGKEENKEKDKKKEKNVEKKEEMV